jgi:hypothetical protein
MREDVEGIYAVDLLFESRPEIPVASLVQALKQACPGIDPLGDLGETLMFAHSSHVVQYREGAIPAQLVIFPGVRKDDRTSIEDAIQQSWSLPRARELVASATHGVLVTDLMARGLPYRERLSLFLDALEAIVTTLPCKAIHWRQSQQVTTAASFLESRRDTEQHLLLGGPLNVRFYNVSNSAVSGESIVDTVGLSVFGLPDIQCHFHGLDVNRLVALLYNLAIYVFENPEAIDSGHTVEGIEPGSRWRCQYEDSMVPPERPVLDLNPGPDHAAGGRNGGPS